MFANKRQSVIIMKDLIEQVVRLLIAVIVFSIGESVSGQNALYEVPGQNALYEVPGLASDKSIIREYRKNVLYGNGQAIMSGCDKVLRLWRNDPAGEINCSNTYNPPFDIETCGQHGDFDLNINYYLATVIFNSIYPPLSSYSVNEKCLD